MVAKGKFIVIEGVDGCGKGTVVRHLEGVFSGDDILFTREPGGTALGERIRELLQYTNMDSATELLLFEASRNEHVTEKIFPALSVGTHVVSDRFDASTFSYQAQTKETREFFLMINNEVTRCCTPDLYIFLDLPIDISRERSKKRGEDPTVFELRPKEYFEKVREGYKEFFRTRRHAVVDATQEPEAVCRKVESLLRAEFGLA